MILPPPTRSTPLKHTICYSSSHSLNIALFTYSYYKPHPRPQPTYKSKLHWLKKLKVQIFMKIPLLTDPSVTANRWGNLLKCTSIIMTRPLERISAISQTGLEASASPSGSSLALTDQTPSRSRLQRSVQSRAKGLHSEGPKLPWWGLCRLCPRLITTRRGLYTSLQSEPK